jgi:formyltetrahydrofolate hydrolase
MLKIRGISNAENLLMGVNRFGHCLTLRITGWQWSAAELPVRVDTVVSDYRSHTQYGSTSLATATTLR